MVEYEGSGEHLTGKVVLVTGAGSGFGALVSEMLAAHGAKVVLSDLNEEALESTTTALRETGGQVLAVRADVTSQEDMTAAVAAAVEAFGTIDVLVNNAGIMPLAYFADHAQAWRAWDLAVDVNIKGVVHGINAVHDLMMENGRGQIVNISSIYGNAGIVGSGVYSATKAAVALISDSLRSEAKGRIKVTTVKPTGVIGTNLGSAVVNEEAISGLVGTRFPAYAARTAEFAEGTLPPEMTDRDDIRLWNLPPVDLARAVVHVIDQPWGISISDITVRASGDDYMY
jgi:NADP-dependent 3-hydroxy acid dehydrogenase YdfG